MFMFGCQMDEWTIIKTSHCAYWKDDPLNKLSLLEVWTSFGLKRGEAVAWLIEGLTQDHDHYLGCIERQSPLVTIIWYAVHTTMV